MIRRRVVPQPLKIVDDFLESPNLWRHFASKLSYEKDSSGYPGLKSLPLDELNENLFHQLAGKIADHVTIKKDFKRLKIQFAYSTRNDVENANLHQDEPFYNVAGLIYLSPNPAPNSGTSFYTLIQNQLIETVTVENIYNRMIIFNPLLWHKPNNPFGTDFNDGRLTITFFGIAI